MPIIRLDSARLSDWDSFHDTFAADFGFPEFYGRNMNAWVDCMSALTEPDEGMTSIQASPTDPVVLHLQGVERIPAEIFAEIVDSTAFVNWRQIESGGTPVLILAFHRSQP